jgi:hypothetical protein
MPKQFIFLISFSLTFILSCNRKAEKVDLDMTTYLCPPTFVYTDSGCQCPEGYYVQPSTTTPRCSPISDNVFKADVVGTPFDCKKSAWLFFNSDFGYFSIFFDPAKFNEDFACGTGGGGFTNDGKNIRYYCDNMAIFDVWSNSICGDKGGNVASVIATQSEDKKQVSVWIALGQAGPNWLERDTFTMVFHHLKK